MASMQFIRSNCTDTTPIGSIHHVMPDPVDLIG